MDLGLRDVLDAGQVQAAFQAVERRWGELNALVCGDLAR